MILPSFYTVLLSALTSAINRPRFLMYFSDVGHVVYVVLLIDSFNFDKRNNMTRDCPWKTCALRGRGHTQGEGAHSGGGDLRTFYEQRGVLQIRTSEHFIVKT